jgi:hypothetical protein
MSFSNKLASSQTLSTKDPWALARRRVHSYLSLQRFSEMTCEQILQQTTQQLPSQPPKTEAEQIQVFLQTAQKIAQLTPNEARVAHWTARTTGPRLERSSIKVAPLQAISLRLTARQAAVGRA